MSACVVAFRSDEVSDGRAHTIGADHELSGNFGFPSIRVPETDAAHAAVGGAREVDQPGSVRDLGTGFASGIDEQRVDDRAPRRVQTIDAVLRLDLDLHGRISVVE